MTVYATADRARERLDRSLPELARADNDPAVLSYALSGIHGALEAHLRSVLASDSRVPREIRDVALDPDTLRFSDIADAMRDHLDLPASEHRMILEADGYRNAQSHGDGFAWDRAGLEGYARYVAQKLGEPVPGSIQPGVAASSTPTAPASPPAVAPAYLDSWSSLAATRPYRAASLLARGAAGLQASHVLLILSALLAVSLLWRWVESAALDAASRAAATPVAAPRPPTVASPPASGQAASPVAVASPPPASGQAAAPAQPPTASGQNVAAASQGEWLVVGNTDGEGVFLRRTPSMGDRLEPYEDGTRMRIIGPDREAEGRRWKHVRAEDGLVGWVPAQYLIAARAP